MIKQKYFINLSSIDKKELLECYLLEAISYQ